MHVYFPFLLHAFILGKIESAAVEHARELNELAKRLSLCALVMSSSDDDSEEDSSDEDAISAKKRPSKSKRKSSTRKRDEKKRFNRHVDDEDGSSLGSAKLVRRRKTHGKSTGRKPQSARGRSGAPRDRHQSRAHRNFEERQEQNQRRLGGRQGGYEGREENLDEYGHESSLGAHQYWRPGPGTGAGGEHRARMTGLRGRANMIRRAMPSTRCFDDGMLHCATDNMSTTGQSVHGRSLGRYGRRAAFFPRPDAPIVKQVRLPVSSD